MRVIDERLEPPRLRPEHRATDRLQPVVAPPIVLAPAVGDEAKLDQPRNRRIERPGAQPQLTSGPLLDLLDHGIAMTLAIGQGEQDVELMRRQRQKSMWIVAHTSNLDALGLDVAALGTVGAWPLRPGLGTWDWGLGSVGGLLRWPRSILLVDASLLTRRHRGSLIRSGGSPRPVDEARPSPESPFPGHAPVLSPESRVPSPTLSRAPNLRRAPPV